MTRLLLLLLLLTGCHGVRLSTGEWADHYAIPSRTTPRAWWIPYEDLSGAERYWVDGHPCRIETVRRGYALLVATGPRRPLGPTRVGWGGAVWGGPQRKRDGWDIPPAFPGSGSLW